MPDALPDTTLPISRLGTGSTNGSSNGRGWGFYLLFYGFNLHIINIQFTGINNFLILTWNDNYMYNYIY
jgi:hypothetical protein